MSEAVEGMVAEWKSEDELSSILYCVRQAGNEFDNVRAVECARGHEIRQRESVQHWNRILHEL